MGSKLTSLQVLETKESLVGQGEMFDREDEIGMDDEDVNMSDVEEVGGNASDDVASDDDAQPESEGTGDSSKNSDVGDDDEELAAFDAKLAEALGTGNNDDHAKDNESSDEDMNDEQMEALDVHLENVFKERKKVMSKKAENKDAKETIVNFKLRVLELLQIYVKQQHTNPLALDLLMPLLVLTRKTTSKQVSEKACNVVREYARLCKAKAVPVPNDEEETWNILNDVHREAVKGGSHTHANACSQSSLLLVKVLVGLDRLNLKEIIDIYAHTRKQQLLDKQCKVQPVLFSEWNNWCTSTSRQSQLK